MITERETKRQRTEVPDSALMPMTMSTDTQSISLMNRIAGPSTQKAGLSKDQSDINRIIYEASKGSKFFDNEARKDEALTRRIEETKQQVAMYASKDLESERANAEADRILIKMEALRDLSKFIVLVDADAFFISVELLDRPDLRGKPCAVGPGVISASSYEARKYGVRSAMPGFIAKKLCPHLVILKHNFEKYTYYSKQMGEVFEKYDPDYATMSLDEAYLDITNYMREHSLNAEETVQRLRREIFEKTQLTVSAGIGPNRLIAKVAAERNKPNGQFCVSNERKSVTEFVQDLPVRKVPGIGRVMERIITDAYGVKTIKDIYAQRGLMYRIMSETSFNFMMQTYLGIGSNEVRPMEDGDQKSMSHEMTFRDISNPEELQKKLWKISEALSRDLESKNIAGRTITLKLKQDDFKLLTRDHTLSRYVHSTDDLFKYGMELLKKEIPITIRLMGLKISKLRKRSDMENGVMASFFGRKSNVMNDNEHENKKDNIDLENLFKIEDMRLIKDEEEKVQVTCPLCNQMLKMTNFEINAHIDLCLNADKISGLTGLSKVVNKPS